jgi:hypothetical protein
MFFEPVLKLLEAKVQSAVSHVSGSAMALAPLFVAIGFGTAAADSWLKDVYGERVAYLILGAAYLMIALVIYAAARARERRNAKVVAQLAETSIINPVREATNYLSLAGVEDTLLALAGRTGAPAVKVVAEQASKNLHLLIGAGIGIYLASRLVDALHGRQANKGPDA